MKAILVLSAHWDKYLHPGLYLRAEKDQDVRGVKSSTMKISPVPPEMRVMRTSR